MREARERVRAALVNCGFEFPLRRIVANLAPASLRKAGPGMDLAIAAALLIASGQLDLGRLPKLALVGELALDGSVRPVPGVLAIAEAARERGTEAIVVPAENGPEAALAGDVGVIAGEPGAALRAGGRGVDARPARADAAAAQAPAPASPTSPTCAASATSATRSRSPPRAATAC